MAKLIRDVMTRGVALIQRDDTLQTAAERMRDLDVGALPVADGQSRVKVESVYCLGLCSVGPAALVGEVVQARLNAASFAALLGAA